MNVVFLVNGAVESAAGERARRIAAQLGADEARLVYRSAGRASDVVAHMREATRGYRIAYAVDLAVVPVLAGVAASLRSRFIVDTGDAPAAFFDLVGMGMPRRIAARGLERLAYGAADLIIVRGSHHAHDLRQRGYRRVRVIPDGVDLAVFRPTEDVELRRRLGLADVFTVGIQGHFTWYPSLGGGMGWELIHAIALRRDLPIHAVIIGDGPGIAELRLLASELGIADRLHVLGRVPYSELPLYLGLCDVCLLTQTNDPSSWVRTTGKLPGYLATGRYVLATRVGTAADVLPDEMLLDYYGSWDLSYPERLAGRIAEVMQDPGWRDKGLALQTLAEQFDYGCVAREAADAIRRTAELAA